MDYLTVALLGLSVFLAAFVPAIFYPNRILRWFKLKIYQYEVTFSLYMLTPMEKFIINSLVFLTISMIIIAAFLYLPEHVVTMSNRAFYYWSGYTKYAPNHGSGIVSAASATASSLAERVVDAGSSIKAAGSEFAHDFAKAARAGERAAEGFGGAAAAAALGNQL